MITVKPNERNCPSFLFLPMDDILNAEQVTTDKCWKCFAGMVLMTRKEGLTVTDVETPLPPAGLYTWHITPGSRKHIRFYSRYMFYTLIHLAKYYDFKKVVRCGGRTDDLYLEHRYEHMRRKIERPFEHLFPDVPMTGDRPGNHTDWMSLTFDGKGEIKKHHSKWVLQD